MTHMYVWVLADIPLLIPASGLHNAHAGLLDDYQRQAKLNENIQSIEDMQKFLERCVLFVFFSSCVDRSYALF